MTGVSRGHHSEPGGSGEPNRMIATGVGDNLTEPVQTVVHHAGAVFRSDFAYRRNVDIAILNLLRVPDEKLHAVRIDAAQIRGDQRIGHQCGCPFWNVDGFEYPSREIRQRLVRDQDIIDRIIHEFLKVARQLGRSVAEK